jgi:hypothetical protein
MTEKPPSDAADHASDFSKRYAEPLDRYCALRMEELGIAQDKLGADDIRPGMPWCAFDPHTREGGNSRRESP